MYNPATSLTKTHDKSIVAPSYLRHRIVVLVGDHLVQLLLGLAAVPDGGVHQKERLDVRVGHRGHVEVAAVAHGREHGLNQDLGTLGVVRMTWCYGLIVLILRVYEAMGLNAIVY